MILAVEIFGIISECAIITYFLCKYFSFKNKDYFVVKAGAFFILLTLYDYYAGKRIESEFLVFAGFLLLSFLFSIIALKGNVFEKLAICSLTFTLIFAVNLPILAISSAITKQYPEVILNSIDKTDILILDTFLSKIVYLGITQAILVVRRKEKFVLHKKEWLVIIASFIISIVIASSVHLLLLTRSAKPTIYLLIAFSLTLLDLIILLFVIWVNRTSTLQEENLQIKLRLKKQKEETELINSKYEETSILRHDFMKHLHTIDELIQKNDTENAIIYIQGLYQKQNETFLHTVYSEQSILDSLLNEKIREAKDKKIDITCRLIADIPVSIQMDVCTILTNLIDNAIEYCSELQDPAKIIVILQKSHGYYRITVKNTIILSILKYNHDLRTRKTNKAVHGWGLKSVHRIAEEHNGGVDIYEDKGMFIVAVTLQEDC